MPNALRAILILVGLLFPSMAFAQCSSSVPLPSNTVLGRLGIGAGPCQAIPMTTLLANIAGGNPLPNKVLAGPTSGTTSAAGTFRSLVGADLPVPGATSLGGVQSLTCSSHNWFNSLSTGGVLACTQPAFSDLTGSVAAAQLPTPTASTLGGVKSLVAVTHQFLTSIGTDGLPVQGQPACGDLSNASASCSTDATNATNISSGTLASARGGAGTITGALKGNGSGVVSQAACADLSNGTTNCSAAVGQLPGTTTNDSAAAGKVGEYVSSDLVVGSKVTLTTATAADITTISLTAGDWMVWVNAYFIGGSTTVIDSMSASISTTLNTLDQTDGKFATVGHLGTVNNSTFLGVWSLPVGPVRISVNATTTIHMVVRADFTTSTEFAYGIIQARRVR